MKIIAFLKKHIVYFKIGIILLLIGGVVAYVYKKNILHSHNDVNKFTDIAESGIRELRSTAGRIRECDRESTAAIKRAGERNKRLAESLDRAEAGTIRNQGRTERIEEIAKRAEDRNRELKKLSDRAASILSELRKNL